MAGVHSFWDVYGETNYESYDSDGTVNQERGLESTAGPRSRSELLRTEARSPPRSKIPPSAYRRDACRYTQFSNLRGTSQCLSRNHAVEQEIAERTEV